ncbi:8567_t:CDS:2, partial [Gigaspora margarita]
KKICKNEHAIDVYVLLENQLLDDDWLNSLAFTSLKGFVVAGCDASINIIPDADIKI